ncbi:PREDICTED: receptor-like protein 12 [Tarenaya hassleriana]|uniref:receptor-like protein 12 n=1 Tax=Tarenaya hassleriana TaxID=28532 RepID=UPI00053C607B|nr:PREDICTED: receptor-like protein 12 [Tarenaya hassleriana]
MKSLILQWLVLVEALVLLSVPDPVQGQCLDDQRALLLRLRSGLIFSSVSSTKLNAWNQTSDCCRWIGVKCDEKGRVTGLDLSAESISGGLDDSSALFDLYRLRSLDLSFNDLNYPLIPSQIGKLANLKHLNLSYSGFGGQIPGKVSNMTRLVVLDLTTYSASNRSLKLENPNLASFVQNFGELTELYLDGVNVSAKGKEWCEALSSSLQNLRVLSMSNCYLSGPIDTSLLKLKHLEKIQLDNNGFSTTVPDFFGEFKNLSFLSLRYCGFSGRLPGKVFQLSKLQTLDLSNNPMLEGTVMEFPVDGSLQILALSNTNFFGTLPESIENLEWLSRLDLAACNFTGQIPRSTSMLKRLVYVDLSSNKFTGTIPSFTMPENLTGIILSNNSLMGELPVHWESLNNLQNLDLSGNMLSGRIPPSLFLLPSLRTIQLSNNMLSGWLEIPTNVSSRNLTTLDLSSNILQGPIKSVFELRELNFLSLAYNNFSGSVELGWFQKLENLSSLDLSYNSLSVYGTVNSSITQLTRLRLALCGLDGFPDLKKQSRLVFLDLSVNQIKGEVPNWLWKVGSGSLMHLNISHNQLTAFEEDYQIPDALSVLDLHYNMFGGNLPLLPPAAIYLDYSDNNFTSSIPSDVDRNLSFSIYLSLSNNSLTGSIPETVCSAKYLQVLDLSDNKLSGEIPECLMEKSSTLGVLNLRRNNLNGSLGDSFPRNCAIETLDLSSNRIRGQVPRSLANCLKLEVLNIGHNQISDTFPCHLKNLSTLRVVVLKSNNFSGPIDCSGDHSPWPMLQIVDLAMNKFTGELKQDCLMKWKAMMGDANATTSYIRFDFLQFSGFSYYQDSVTYTSKGQELELSKILTIYTAIDLSSNDFQGPIPDAIGELKELCILNLSRNAFTGPIPSVLSNLQQLESLDLSSNNLTGEIPKELTNLNFLSYLNLSNNQLVGEIPKGPQFQTFSEESFEGNKGLCGIPLKKRCRATDKSALSHQPRHSNSEEDDSEWIFVSAAFGFGFGFWIFIGSLVLWRRWRTWYNIHVDQLLLMIFPQLEQTNRGRRTRKQNNRNPKRRFIR